MWRDTSATAHRYDEKIISETSVAWAIHLAMITRRVAGRQRGVLCGGPRGPLSGGRTTSVREEGSLAVQDK